MRILKKIFYWLLIAFLLLTLLGVGYYFYITKDVVLKPEKLLLSEHSITLYDQHNTQIACSSCDIPQQRIDFAHLPEHTKFAFICAEDKRFYSHHGFDWRRIAKSAYNNLKARSFQQGASTISQQLIKNTHLTHEKTLKRKLQEFKLTRKLEKKYTKEEILERYLSVIYFGHNCFGLRSAAAFYFDKSPSELTLDESAILAGLVKSPNNYSPFNNAKNCQIRKVSVLSAMQKNGYITPQEKQKAIQKPLPTPQERKMNALGYARYVFEEFSALSEVNHFTVAGEIKIYTYLDSELQQKTEEIAANHTQSDKTFAVIDKQTTGIKAYVSSISQTPRLPGSLLKPLLVYAPAIEENVLSPATPLLDEQISYGEYTPRNYDGKYHGYVSARECLANSLNIPAVKVLETIGVEKGVSYLEKLRLPVEKDDYSLALALGGMKHGYSLKNLMSAYAALANEGIFQESGFIKRIVVNGAEQYVRNPKQTRVYSSETAYLTTNMLQTAAKTGTAKKLRSLPFEIAAKTGTVGTEKGNTDAYAVSYTTKDIVGVWLGNRDNRFIQTTGGGLPCNYLFALNEYLYKNYTTQQQTVSPFPVSEKATKIPLDKTAYQHLHLLAKAEEICPIEQRFDEWFKTSNIPTKTTDYYSSPHIETPTIQYQNNRICMQFNNCLCLPYLYQIERTDDTKKKWETVYFGECIDEFQDETITQGKTYIYKITPYYQQNKGNTITLPKINTTQQQLPSLSDKEIAEKEWWKY